MSKQIKLENGGQFDTNYARLMNLKFEVGEGNQIKLVAEDRAGDVRKLVVESINSANIRLNNEAHRFDFTREGEERWTRARTYTRKLSSGAYDLTSGTMEAQEKIVDCLGGTFRIPVSGTNLHVANMSISDGFQAWIWVCHVDYQSSQADNNTKATGKKGPASAVEEL